MEWRFHDLGLDYEQAYERAVLRGEVPLLMIKSAIYGHALVYQARTQTLTRAPKLLPKSLLVLSGHRAEAWMTDDIVYCSPC